MNEEAGFGGLGDCAPRIAEHLHAAGLRLHQARDLLEAARPEVHTIAEKHVVAALQAVDEALRHSSALAVGIARQGLSEA